MQSINGIASIEIEEDLVEAVEDFDLNTVNDLLYRFSFSEEFLKELSIDVVEKNSDTDKTNLEIALILLQKTGKTTKQEFLNHMKKTHQVLFQYLCERIDL